MKTSARMFLGFAAFGIASGVIYASINREFVGVVGFFAFAAANIFLAVLMVLAGDPEERKRALEAGGIHEEHETHLPPPSIWPFVIAVGAAVIAWGTLLRVPVVAVGILILLSGAAGWAGGFKSINRDLAAWGEVWRHRQYRNLERIEEELAAAEEAEGPRS